MFKVIESEEEFKEALSAGLLWSNKTSTWPRRAPVWEPLNLPVDAWSAGLWSRAVARKSIGVTTDYLPCDFAVYIEE
jgi:hypothetical protein